MNTLLSILKLQLILALGYMSFDSLQDKNTITLNIDIEVTKYNKGQIAIALFNNSDDFLKTPIRSDAIAVKENKVTVVFTEIPKGTYSFSYYHDVNFNNELDTNFMGIPKEPYGFSNDQKGSFGPPSFEEAKITLNKDTTLQLTIK